MIIENEPLIIRDGEQRLIEVQPLLTSQRRRFRQYYAMAARFLSEAGEDIDRAFDQNGDFRHCVDVCLEQFGLDVNLLDLRTVTLLLFSRPIPSESGEPAWGNGVLIDWEFPAAAESADPSEAMTDIDPDLYDLTALWMSDGGSLKEILELSEVMPHRRLAELVRTKYRLLEKQSDKSKTGEKAAINPKVIGRDGQTSDLDIAAELSALKEDLIQKLSGEAGDEDRWVPVNMAGIG